MSRWVALPVAAPLAAAALAMIAARVRTLQRMATVVGVTVVLGSGISLVAATAGGRTIATQVGGWPPGIAIPLAADLFASLMLVIAAVMILVATWFAFLTREDEGPLFHPLVLVLTTGISTAFLTADLFNLFVAFEVMLIASYVLMTLGGSSARVRAGAVYVTTNVLASLVLLAGVALTYALAGTVQLGALRAAAAAQPALAVPGALLLVAFAVKSSLVPVHGWLPRAYPVASPAVAALFSGLLTKVGIYAMYRVYAIVFSGDPAFRSLLLGIAAVTMIIGVLGAIGRSSMREILSFHIVSQVGYMVMGLGLFSALGVAGGIFYILHHIVVKTSLFLTAGAIETREGSGDLDSLSGLARRYPVLAAAFAVSALSLAGLPPLSGFTAKLVLVRAAFADGEHLVAVVALAVGVLTLLSMLKIWSNVFWGDGPDKRSGGNRLGRLLPGPALSLAVLSIILGFGAQGLLLLAESAGDALIDPAAYLEAVMTS